jgi:hypothetical protein
MPAWCLVSCVVLALDLCAVPLCPNQPGLFEDLGPIETEAGTYDSADGQCCTAMTDDDDHDDDDHLDSHGAGAEAVWCCSDAGQLQAVPQLLHLRRAGLHQRPGKPS